MSANAVARLNRIWGKLTFAKIKRVIAREPKDILSFVLYQAITRSIVTAWGTTVEKMVKYAGCEDNDDRNTALRGKNFELKKIFRGTEYYIQVKSGPNTMNVGMVQSLNETISKLAAGKKAFLGMTYGTRERISPQIMGNLNDPNKQTKVGRELWDFVAEEQDFYKKVMSAISQATEGVLDENFIDLVNNRINDLAEEWVRKYKGLTLIQVLEKYL